MSQHDATPPVGGVILGVGGTFKVPEAGWFEGWARDGRFVPEWTHGSWEGTFIATIYAAPEGSEVVKLNTPESETPRTDAECSNNGIGLPLTTVRADFARQLERENRRLRERLEVTLESWRDEANEMRREAEDEHAEHLESLILEVEEALAGRGEG